jgi:hypothetical protein
MLSRVLASGYWVWPPCVLLVVPGRELSGLVVVIDRHGARWLRRAVVDTESICLHPGQQLTHWPSAQSLQGAKNAHLNYAS